MVERPAATSIMLASAMPQSNVKKVATRDSYGSALKELGATAENLVVLDADLAGATKTNIFRWEAPSSPTEMPPWVAPIFTFRWG